MLTIATSTPRHGARQASNSRRMSGRVKEPAYVLRRHAHRGSDKSVTLRAAPTRRSPTSGQLSAKCGLAADELSLTWGSKPLARRLHARRVRAAPAHARSDGAGARGRERSRPCFASRATAPTEWRRSRRRHAGQEADPAPGAAAEEKRRTRGGGGAAAAGEGQEHPSDQARSRRSSARARPRRRRPVGGDVGRRRHLACEGDKGALPAALVAVEMRRRRRSRRRTSSLSARSRRARMTPPPTRGRAP